jgi:hypothetical protein
MMKPVSMGTRWPPSRATSTVWVCPPSQSSASKISTSCWEERARAAPRPEIPAPMMAMCMLSGRRMPFAAIVLPRTVPESTRILARRRSGFSAAPA